MFLSRRLALGSFSSVRYVHTVIPSEMPAGDLHKTGKTKLTSRPWAYTPFAKSSKLLMPLFKFETGEFSGNNLGLDHTIFNQPLRRDLVQQAVLWEERFGKVTTKFVKRVGDVAGSGAKPRPQKGSGRARQGNKRSPINRGGGKAHGPVPRELTISLPKKKRTKALKAALSAKLFEDKVLFVDSEKVSTHKSKFVNRLLEDFAHNRVLVVTPSDVCKNFEIGLKNIPKRETVTAQKLSVLDVLNADFLVFTQTGLTELETILKGRVANQYRMKHIPRGELPHDHLVVQKKEKIDIYTKIEREFKIDELEIPENFQVISPVLKTYIKDVEKASTSSE